MPVKPGGQVGRTEPKGAANSNGNMRGPNPNRGGNAPRGGSYRGQGQGQGHGFSQGSNQGGGYQGGGGGGGGSSFIVKEQLPHEKAKETPAPLGWVFLPADLQSIQLPTRTQQAKECSRKVNIRLNHFPVEIKLPANLYRYQVAILKQSKDETSTTRDNRPPPKFMYPAIHKNLLAILRSEFATKNKGNKAVPNFGVISDGASTIYSTHKLESTSFQKEVEYIPLAGEDGRREMFLAKIELTDESVETKGLQSILDNMKGQPIMPELMTLDRIYNTLLKNLSTERFTAVGRSSLIQFDDEHGSTLGKGLMSYSGYDINFDIMNGWRPYLNIIVANNATMMSGNVVDILANLLKSTRQKCLVKTDWTDEDIRTASKFLETFKVKYSPTPDMTFGGTVTRLSSRSVSEEKFMWKDGDKPEREVSVYQYYVEKYNRKDLHKDGICLVVNQKNNIPAEICILKQGQSCHRKLDGDQTTAMLNLSKKDPSRLQPEIQRAIVELNLRNDPILSAFGVSLKPDVSMLNMPAARVLAPPIICYSKNSLGQAIGINPVNGVWDNWRSANTGFLEPAHVDKWAVLFTCKGYRGADLSHDLGGFVTKFTDIAKRAGMMFKTRPLSTTMGDVLKDFPSAKTKNMEALGSYFEGQKEAGCRVVLVIVPTDKCHVYTHVKQSSELYSGLLTQCVTAKHFEIPNDSEIKNILLKMNSKLGGINHTVMAPPGSMPFRLFEDPVLILGADVTHPPPGSNWEETGFSYAALVSSYDRTGMRYMIQVKAQKADNRNAKAAEVIKDFDVFIKESLTQFRIKTNQTPKKIIYFRDGVGDGQFKELLHSEMRDIRKACSSLNPTYQPKVTFITVQKRHKTRFFLQGSNGQVENAPPGTVVDTDIIHPTEIDSFLLSHKGILGTSRPTRYHVLWDDSNFSEDQIQQMTYYLCHMYTRCNRAVSIPAPTFYAHHAASRAKILAEGLRGNVEEINGLLQRTQLNMTNPMHFT